MYNFVERRVPVLQQRKGIVRGCEYESVMLSRLRTQRELGLMAPLPPWIDREQCVFSETKTHVSMTFGCSRCSKPKAAVMTRLKDLTESELSAKLAECAETKHRKLAPDCLGTKEGALESAAPNAREQQLEEEVRRQKRKVRDKAVEAELAS